MTDRAAAMLLLAPLRSALKARVETQRIVAERAGVNPAMLSHIQHGRRLPTLTVLIAVCRAVGLRVVLVEDMTPRNVAALPTEEDPARGLEA
jgi:transcriptional regulator with XRE-family HTH domain